MQPPAMPPAVMACPLRDTLHARAAGDSAGRRVSAAGHVALGIPLGITAGVSGLMTVAGGQAAPSAVFAASLLGMGANVVVGARSTSPPARDSVRIASCDAPVRAVYRQAYAARATRKRARSAFWSGFLSTVVSAATLMALIIAALSSGSFT